MIVQCPECTTKYNLDDSKIGHDGSKVRCTRCKNVFTVFKPLPAGLQSPAAAAPQPAPKPAPTPAADAFDDDLGAMFEDRKAEPAQKPSAVDDFESELESLLGGTRADTPRSAPAPTARDFEDELDTLLGGGTADAPRSAPKQTIVRDFEDELDTLLDGGKGEAPKPAPKPAAKSSVDEDMIADLQGAFQQPLVGTPGRDPLLDEESTAKPAKSGKLGLILGLLAVLLAAGLGAVYFLQPGLIGLGPKEPAATTSAVPAPKEGAAQIALENVRQYFVPNEKEGQLFIIEGKAVNRFTEARELIRLKASLFDRQGGEVAAQEFMCGNVVSLYQLQVSSRADIEAALTAKVGILTNNTNVQPGASVPFMVVFFQTPESVEEFGLEVIQSAAPQQ